MSSSATRTLLVVVAVLTVAGVLGLAALSAIDGGADAAATDAPTPGTRAGGAAGGDPSGVRSGSIDRSTANPAPPQFLRNQERATIIAAALDHQPMARGATARLAVEVEMLPGMHVNANPATHDWMIPIEASVAGVDGIEVLDAFYPEAESRKFPYDDAPYLVYEGRFVIGLVIAVAAHVPPSGPMLEIVVDYQACNDEACFAPAAARFELPVLIVADAEDAVRVSPPLFERAPFPR